ncbi:complex I NDUFA9 subunit family protein [Tropicimonas sp. IMCC34043]|uniref:complex I NDUFA9 subunit family protein n=1 Tax=Tropicimonas sp. IMCC34043 TaxID=2248760 RepID=UPI000E2774FE|nr:complex I NDUFA9 subunit family protein [Tropicimonas sp. IMCC34043]
MSGLVTIYGGSGFVGRYIVRRMAKDGWRVKVATRVPNESAFVRTYGEVGQVEPVLCNIRNEDSVRAAMQGADVVINCVGILAEHGKNSFEALQVEGAGRIARLAAEAGIARMVHISAIGADAGSDSAYGRTKAAGEAAVRAAMPGAVILRPSIIFGPEDEFFNRFAAMSKFGPALTIVGADTKFQPVYVDDVARAAVLAAEGKVAAGVYELGGPDVATFRALMEQMLEIIRSKKMIANMPFVIARVMAGVFGIVEKVSFGAFDAPLTADQLRNLAHDNVVAEGAKGFADIGIVPTSMASVLPEYLWRFRPHGQFEIMTESAAKLKV